MVEGINIHEYIDMFKRKKWLVIIIILLSLAFGGYRMYQNYISYVPRYTASVTVKINSAKQQQQNEDDTTAGTGTTNNYYNYNTAAMDQNIAATYYKLASSTSAYNQAAAIAGVDPRNLQSISSSPQEDIPQFVTINVVAKDAISAQKLANAMPEVFNNELIRIVGIDCVESVYEANKGVLIPRARDLSIAKCGIVGVVLAVFVVLLLECLNTKIITPDDVEKYWELPLIGVIPMDNGKSKGRHSVQK